MLVGIGTDLVLVSRIQNVLQRFGGRFLKRAFSDSEIAVFHERTKGNATRGVEYLASRWAIKEASYKVLSGMSGSRIPFPEISSSTLSTGENNLVLFCFWINSLLHENCVN